MVVDKGQLLRFSLRQNDGVLVGFWLHLNDGVRDWNSFCAQMKRADPFESARLCCGSLRFHAKRPRRHEVLLGGEFFLFAFHAHLLEFALFRFDRRGDFLLDLGCRFLELW